MKLLLASLLKLGDPVVVMSSIYVSSITIESPIISITFAIPLYELVPLIVTQSPAYIALPNVGKPLVLNCTFPLLSTIDKISTLLPIGVLY